MRKIQSGAQKHQSPVCLFQILFIGQLAAQYVLHLVSEKMIFVIRPGFAIEYVKYIAVKKIAVCSAGKNH